MNSLPSMMTWTCNKGARSEPAEMGVPFSGHSAISRSNKKKKNIISSVLFLFVAIFFYLYLFNARFLTELGITFRFSLL